MSGNVSAQINKSNLGSATPVLIVGAGPTGLALALWLKKKGIEFRIIDKSSKPGTTSRALAVQARTLEFYRQLGIADQLIQAGVLVKEITMLRRGRPVATAKLGALGEGQSYFPYLLFCSQEQHEEILIQQLQLMGGKVERNCELLDLDSHEDHVKVLLKTSTGTETLAAQFLCGCDGAHSTVRHKLGINFGGGTYPHVFYVADVVVESGSSSIQGLSPINDQVQLSLSPDDFCIIMPLKSLGTVRLTGIVPREVENKENLSYADVAQSVARNTRLKVVKVNWFSRYSIHHRVAEEFQRNRIFLAGDAAHIHSPAGGQGMNTGIGDAVNIAWKLAEVLSGRFSDKLLESYTPERKTFAETLVKTTDTAFQIVAGRSWFGSLFRGYWLPDFFALLTRTKTFLRFAFRTISQIRIHYRNSPLSQDGSGKIQAGDRLPWIKWTSGDNYESLKSLNWQIHIYGEATKDFRQWLANQNFELHEFPWNKITSAKGLIEDAVYLIRPDGHIATIIVIQDPASITDYFQEIGILRP